MNEFSEAAALRVKSTRSRTVFSGLFTPISLFRLFALHKACPERNEGFWTGSANNIGCRAELGFDGKNNKQFSNHHLFGIFFEN